MNFTETLLFWYDHNKRDLPWRHTSDPYKIWVSEVILQQTRVDQGLPYYLKFINQFPDVSYLARASEQEVLNVWKGLGYYSRARNIHQTAIVVENQYNGIFPSDYNSLIMFKGIGPYTAAAISSICSNENRVAIDGNVIRVLSRYFGLYDTVGSTSSMKKLNWISTQMIPVDRPGVYNQAIMEYGATVCTPSSPKCGNCLLNMTCYAFKNKMVSLLPVRKKSRSKVIRFINYLVVCVDNHFVIINQRKSDDIWKNLWDFPSIEDDHLLNSSEILMNLPPFLDEKIEHEVIRILDTTHILSHQVLNIRFFVLRAISSINIDSEALKLIQFNDPNYPMPRVIENFLKRNNIFFGYE